MRERDFGLWLDRWYRTADGCELDPRSRGSMRSCVARVEKSLGSLDRGFAEDRGAAMLAALDYSKEDARRGRPPPRGLRVTGNLYNVLASLRRAAVLYLEFCKAWPAGASSPSGPPPPPQPPAKTPTDRAVARRPGSEWPTWPLPSEADQLALAAIVAHHARFLHPDVVARVIDDTESRRPDWETALRVRGVDPAGYLWARSPCAFPGVRRYAGSDEIAAFRGRQERVTAPSDAIALDDNDYPKHVWSFVLRGRPFQKFGPSGYALAHLADHKSYDSRLRDEVQVGAVGEGGFLPGLFTSLTNVAYVPTDVVRPTDHSPGLRNLLLRRAHALYGSRVHLFPPPYEITRGSSPAWALERFEWADPVGSADRVDAFLAFRTQAMAVLLTRSHKPASGATTDEGSLHARRTDAPR